MLKNQVRIGNVEITSFSDGALEFDLCNFFPSIPAENWQAHVESLTPEHRVRFNLASFLVRSDGHTVLVDTGLGPKPADAPESAWGELLHDLTTHGIRLDEIDMVVMTHLHRDHVGWNLMARGGKYQPTFPRARYWMSAQDWEACHRLEVRERFPNAPTCVWPLEELGLLELMEGEHVLTSNLTALPTPGHTPGHMSILISSQGERGLVLGDAAHHPAQVQEPSWVSRADMNPEQTRATRRTLLDRLEREETLIAAGHFPAPGFGKLVRLNGRRYWQPL